MWKYKHHELLQKALNVIERPCRFIKDLSWKYAHYRNGTFPYQFPEKPRTRWLDKSLKENIKETWKASYYKE